MRKLNLFSLAFATMMLGACSSDEIAVNENGSVPVLPGETGYINLSINLPTTPSTRANDKFDDGLAAEYKVNDATLLIFNGTDEAQAKLSGIYPLTGLQENVIGTDNNITATHQITQAITKPASGNVYALVIVNKGNVLTESGGTWSLNGTQLTTGASGTEFQTFYNTAQTITVDKLASVTDDTDGSFFMTNAPLYNVAGGTAEPTGGQVTTLTEINPNNIYTTKDEAEDNPAASIYVERAVAKVTVTGSNGTLTETITGLGQTGYTLTGWTLDVTNTQSYIVRNVSAGTNWWTLKSAKLGSNDYRFVGSVPVGNQLYRTYWGVDPNYDGIGSYIPSGFNMLTGDTPTGADLTAINGNAYCLENTFNVSNMNQDQTTRVIVAATLNNGADFYIVDNDKNTIYTEEEATKAIKAEYLSNPTVIAALTDPTTGLMADQSIGEGDLDVEFDDTEGKPTNGGDLTVKEITIKDGSKNKFNNNTIPEVLTAAGNADIIAAVNAGKKVSFYKGGVSYYPVMIKHFGDEQTPWAATDANNAASYPVPNADANWLGRYGVLRNNWYEITVKSIKGIGSAEVPKVYGTPDDPVNSYISVEINILSWAKRSQSVDL